MNIVKSGTELETSVYKKPSDATDKSTDTLGMVMYSIPFIDQKTTERTRKQLENFSSKICLFTSHLHQCIIEPASTKSSSGKLI